MASVDRRRIGGPEESVPLIYDAARTIGDDAPNDALFMKAGLINQANGSAYTESGAVKLACAVYGPRPKAPPYTPDGTLNVEVKFAPFASDPRRAPLRDTEPAAISTLLCQLLTPAVHLHLLPKSSIDVFLYVLESGDIGEMLSAGLSVASTALADAGIAMSGLSIGGVSYGPEKSHRAVVGSLPALQSINSLLVTGEGSIDEICSSIEAAVNTARETHSIAAETLLEQAGQIEA